MQPESAAQSSTYSDGVAEKAIDGSLSTRSHSRCETGLPIWFTLIFFEKHCFKKFRIYPTHSHELHNRERMNGATLEVKDEGDENINKEIICDTIDLAGKLNDAYVDLECSSPLYGDLVELRIEKKDSVACIHMFEIESYAVELECPEGSVMEVSDGKCSCVSAGKNCSSQLF